MFKKFTTHQLIFIALLGSFLFVLDFILSIGITTATGIPGSGYLLTSFFFVCVATIGGLLVRRLGTFTLMSFIYGVLSGLVPPLPWVWTVLLCVVSGFAADIVALLFSFKTRGYYLVMVVGNLAGLPAYLWILLRLGLPGAEQFAQYFWLFTVIYAVTGIIGTSVGMWIYQHKVLKMQIAKQLAG